MGRYYNKARRLRSFTLRDGTTAVFAAKAWTPIPKELEGSGELLRAVKAGRLVYRPDPVPEQDPPPKPKPKIVKTPASKPKETASKKSAQTDSSATKKGKKRTTKKKS